MGFQFAAIYGMNTETGTIGMIAVIVFLILFEYMVDCVEILEEYAPATYEMVQCVFKELMIMGIVSFLIVMFETTSYAQNATEMVLAIDYCHILLFYVALFFVFHAFLLIRLMGYLGKQYDKFHYTDIKSILSQADGSTLSAKLSSRLKLLFASNYRRTVEFKVLSTFFHQAFRLPYDFQFSDYLKGSFENYALRLLNISPLTWALLIILCLINLGRVEILKISGIHNKCTKSRSLGAASSASEINPLCADYDIEVFLVFGALLALLSFILYFISRQYELR